MNTEEATEKQAEETEAGMNEDNSANDTLSTQKIKVHISATKFKCKPKGWQIGILKTEFTEPETIQDLTVEEIAKALTSGQTIQPGVTPFSEESRADPDTKGTVARDFTQQQVFFIDHDNDKPGISYYETPESAEKKLSEHNLKSAFMYFSFSSTPERPRFRTCIVCDEVITDREERDRIQTRLVSLYTQADTGCNNADRMYFGTNKGLCEGFKNFNARCKKSDLLALMPAASAVKNKEGSAEGSSGTASTVNKAASGKTGSAEELRERCAFIGYCWEHAETLTHPYWHGAISNVAQTADGHEAVHEMSKPYPKYKYDETEQQYQNAICTDKPQTCEYIKSKIGFNCGKSCGVKAPIALVHTKKTAPVVWDDPVPLDESPLPPFPVDALPDFLKEHVLAVSESTQTPVDLSAVTALSVVSICSRGKYSVQVKPDWNEGLNTYTLAIMPPSERKSPVCKAMIGPVNAFEQQWNDAHRTDVDYSRVQKAVLEGKLKKAQENAVKGKAKAGELRQASDNLSNFRELKEMNLYSDNITPEKLVSNMADNDGVSAIYSSEAGIFNILKGAYSQHVNFDVFLKGYSNESICVERVGRGREKFSRASLSVLLMAQPSVLAGVVSDANFSGRGLTARFLYCKPNSTVGSRDYYSRSVPQEVYDRYDQCIRYILQNGAYKSHEIIQLSPDAQTLFLNFANKTEKKIKTEYADIEEWVGKLLGNIARIAGLLCLADMAQSITINYATSTSNLTVSEETMENAISIGEYFVEHSKAALSLLGVDSNIRKCKKLLENIKKEHRNELTRRDAMVMYRALGKAEEVQLVINCLVDYGYLQKKEQAYTGKGRPTGDTYLVNPKIYAES